MDFVVSETLQFETMLSGLANLIMGGAEPTAVPLETFDLKVTVTDDEWQIVDSENQGQLENYVILRPYFGIFVWFYVILIKLGKYN